MVEPAVILQGGVLPSPEVLLVGLVALALVILVGRFILSIAWRLVIIALVAVAVLWLLGFVGIEFGILGLVELPV